MKKIFIIALVVLLIPSFAFSIELSDKSKSEIQSIAKIAESMTETETMLFANQSQMKSTVPFLLNFFVGCGVGSFVQGDKTGGYIAIAGDAIGIGFLAVTYSKLLDAETQMINNINDPDYAEVTKKIDSATSLCIAGAIELAAVRIFECIRPFMYTKEYNKQLNSAVYSSVTTSVLPVIVNNNLQVGIVTNISF